jgi:hypothetical protein
MWLPNMTDVIVTTMTDTQNSASYLVIGSSMCMPIFLTGQRRSNNFTLISREQEVKARFPDQGSM